MITQVKSKMKVFKVLAILTILGLNLIKCEEEIKGLESKQKSIENTSFLQGICPYDGNLGCIIGNPAVYGCGNDELPECANCRCEWYSITGNIECRCGIY